VATRPSIGHAINREQSEPARRLPWLLVSLEETAMRVRYVGLSVVLIALISVFGMLSTAIAAPTATSTSPTKVSTPSPTPTKPAATKAAATATSQPAVEATATDAATAPAATETTTAEAASGTPVAETPTAVITLVLWYDQTPNGGPLKLSPIQINENGVAGPSTAANPTLTGSVDFEDPNANDLPRITIGDSHLDGYAVTPDDPNTVLRWTYYNDDPDLRPATLVVQVNASAGPYKGYDGTATFISRASKAGGVLVIALNPPAS
jgi:hypothetical protein